MSINRLVIIENPQLNFAYTKCEVCHSVVDTLFVYDFKRKRSAVCCKKCVESVAMDVPFPFRMETDKNIKNTFGFPAQKNIHRKTNVRPVYKQLSGSPFGKENVDLRSHVCFSASKEITGRE